MQENNKIEMVDMVALELENARLRNENTKLHDIIDRVIITLAEANPFYLAALFAARQTVRKEQEKCCCNVKKHAKTNNLILINLTIGFRRFLDDNINKRKWAK